MNGSSNGSINSIFESHVACQLVGDGFAIEEKLNYNVVKKTVNGKTYFKPCLDVYLKEQAEKYGYHKCDRVV